MTGLAGVVCVAGMEWAGEVSCVNLVHSRQRKPLHMGVLCTMISRLSYHQAGTGLL